MSQVTNLPSPPNMPTGITAAKSHSQVLESLKQFTTSIDPETILKTVEKELNQTEGKLSVLPNTPAFKALTLLEFENGLLMSISVADYYQTFAIQMSRDLQKEFRCQTPGERATAELAAVNYIRVLDIQRRIKNYLDRDTFTDLGVKYVDVLSRELDRANRHYLTSMEALRMLRRPPLNLSIKTQTAIVGQNQMVQANNNAQSI